MKVGFYKLLNIHQSLHITCRNCGRLEKPTTFQDWNFFHMFMANTSAFSAALYMRGLRSSHRGSDHGMSDHANSGTSSEIWHEQQTIYFLVEANIFNAH